MDLRDRGVLEVGRRADFVVLDGDPTRDIGAMDRIETVWRGGVRTDGPLAASKASAGTP
jgi:imidazolonepropionase-like amidohydrolase